MTTLRSRVIAVLLGERLLSLRRRFAEHRRRLGGRPHAITAFLELDDPYSYLLANYLPELRRHYDVELSVLLTERPGEQVRPEPALYAEYALRDAERVAGELGVAFLDVGDTPPVEHRRALIDALAARETAPGFVDEVLAAITAYWRGDAESVARRAEAGASAAGAAMLERNRKRLAKLGHYDTAMLHYAGEWYRGVDRLTYLADRLDALGAAAEPGLAPRIASIRRVMRADLPVSPPATADTLPAIEMFHSFRSPYSYLALARIMRIADAFGVGLDIRPVLPMVTRGLPLPAAKRRYIAMDAAREARRLAVPFGRIADPLGTGVERCHAVFEYAKSEKRERDFVLAAGRAIWAKGVDVSTDEGLRKVTGRAGLFWPDVVEALGNVAWREQAETNREALTDAGCWGVPTFQVGGWATWGQDRDWLVARRLEALCEDGGGIIV